MTLQQPDEEAIFNTAQDRGGGYPRGLRPSHMKSGTLDNTGAETLISGIDLALDAVLAGAM